MSSRVINHGLAKLFDFINGYRVREFIALRQDERNEHLNILELAYQLASTPSRFQPGLPQGDTGQSRSDFLKSSN